MITIKCGAWADFGEVPENWVNDEKGICKNCIDRSECLKEIEEKTEK